MLKPYHFTRRELFFRVTLAIYLLVLLWLVLFKFSFDIALILETHQTRSMSLVPFTGHLREAADNLIVFIPFGALLSITFTRIAFWQKLAVITLFSLTVEAVQFMLAIGITDITDIITNTAGGLVGLTLYALLKKYVSTVKLDYFITIACLVLIALLLALRFFVFKVRY